MNVKFSFDKTAVERRVRALEDAHGTIKRLSAVMRDTIPSLLRTGRFTDCAACVRQDEGGGEDTLAQAGKVRRSCHV